MWPICSVAWVSLTPAHSCRLPSITLFKLPSPRFPKSYWLPKSCLFSPFLHVSMFLDVRGSREGNKKGMSSVSGTGTCLPASSSIVAFAKFHGVNIPNKDALNPPGWCHWLWSWAAMWTTGSGKLLWSGSSKPLQIFFEMLLGLGFCNMKHPVSFSITLIPVSLHGFIAFIFYCGL